MTLVTIFINKSIQESLVCNSKILQYYGLEGMSSAVPYSPIEKLSSDNFCPNIHETCCTAEDFDKTREMWQESSKRLKTYLTQVFRVLQKIALIQSSLIQYIPKIESRDAPACKKIDSTFFNSAVKFDEVHFYVRNAFEAFAYIQKGFYCMICDSTKQKMFKSKLNYGRRVIQMSEQSCDDLVFFFREYLAYKIYFFDPLVRQMNNVVNCVKNTDINYFDNEHMVSYQGVSDCLLNKNYCYKVCKEFRIGVSSNLFIGKLSEYKKLLSKMEDVLKEMTNSKDSFDELQISDEEISNEFFLRKNDTISANSMTFLKDSNLSKAEILFSKEGIDLFRIAVSSNYFLVDETNLDQIQNNYDIKEGDEELNRLNPIKVNSVEEYDKPRQELINPLPNKVSLVVAIVEKTDNKNAAKSNVIATDSSGLEEPDLKNEKSVEELEKQYQDNLVKETEKDPALEKLISQNNNTVDWGYFTIFKKFFKSCKRISMSVILIFCLKN